MFKKEFFLFFQTIRSINYLVLTLTFHRVNRQDHIVPPNPKMASKAIQKKCQKETSIKPNAEGQY